MVISFPEGRCQVLDPPVYCALHLVHREHKSYTLGGLASLKTRWAETKHPSRGGCILATLAFIHRIADKKPSRLLLNRRRDNQHRPTYGP